LFSSLRSSSASDINHTTSSSPLLNAEAQGIATQHTMDRIPRAHAQNARYVDVKITALN
jgi:hypothetical protein